MEKSQKVLFYVVSNIVCIHEDFQYDQFNMPLKTIIWSYFRKTNPNIKNQSHFVHFWTSTIVIRQKHQIFKYPRDLKTALLIMTFI